MEGRCRLDPTGGASKMYCRGCELGSHQQQIVSSSTFNSPFLVVSNKSWFPLCFPWLRGMLNLCGSSQQNVQRIGFSYYSRFKYKLWSAAITRRKYTTRTVVTLNLSLKTWLFSRYTRLFQSMLLSNGFPRRDSTFPAIKWTRMQLLP